VQSAVLAWQVLPPLRLVRTARRTYSFQARVSGLNRPAPQSIQSGMGICELENLRAVIG